MDDSPSLAERISAIECVLEERFPGCIGQDVVADVLAPAADVTAQPTGANDNGGDEETAGSAGEGPGETASESEEEKEAENQEAQDEEAPEKGSQEVA